MLNRLGVCGLAMLAAVSLAGCGSEAEPKADPKPRPPLPTRSSCCQPCSYPTVFIISTFGNEKGLKQVCAL